MMTEEMKIASILKDLGIAPNLLGYLYLKYAVQLAVQDITFAYSVTKRMYPEVAKHFKSSPTRVERAMRVAIELGWKKGCVTIQRKLFGYTVDADDGCPTNGSFVATVADYVNMIRGEDYSYGT